MQTDISYPKSKMTTPAPNEYHDKAFANRLSIFRKQYVHKSQNKAAEMLKVPQSNLSYMENGKSPIRFDFIAKLVKNFALNQDWFATGNGKPTDKNPPKANLLTDINALNEELTLLKKQIRIMELNQNHFIKIIERLEKKIEQNS